MCVCPCCHCVPQYLWVGAIQCWGVHYPLLLNSDPSSQLSPCIFHRRPMTRVHVSVTDLTATASPVLTRGERLSRRGKESALEGEGGRWWKGVTHWKDYVVTEGRERKRRRAVESQEKRWQTAETRASWRWWIHSNGADLFGLKMYQSKRVSSVSRHWRCSGDAFLHPTVVKKKKKEAGLISGGDTLGWIISRIQMKLTRANLYSWHSGESTWENV